FYPNKQLTTGEGGMLVTNHAPTARICRSLRNQGRDEDAGWLRHIHLGFNYRLSDLHAAVGLAQLERIEYLLAARARVAAWYARHLAGNHSLVLPAEVPGSKRSWFVYVVQLSGAAPKSLRDHLLESLRSRGIECAAYFPAIHRQPYFREYCGAPRYSLTRAEFAADHCLALPFFPSMSQEQVVQVCAAIREILQDAPRCVSADQPAFAAAASSAAH
ncbi:MAG: DegT/DnrJ/EryC1/StrS family aminotransferase, partial [Candidatus Acidiferrales bacterium]